MPRKRMMLKTDSQGVQISSRQATIWIQEINLQRSVAPKLMEP